MARANSWEAARAGKGKLNPQIFLCWEHPGEHGVCWGGAEGRGTQDKARSSGAALTAKGRGARRGAAPAWQLPRTGWFEAGRYRGAGSRTAAGLKRPLCAMGIWELSHPCTTGRREGAVAEGKRRAERVAERGAEMHNLAAAEAIHPVIKGDPRAQNRDQLGPNFRGCCKMCWGVTELQENPGAGGEQAQTRPQGWSNPTGRDRALAPTAHPTSDLQPRVRDTEGKAACFAAREKEEWHVVL